MTKKDLVEKLIIKRHMTRLAAVEAVEGVVTIMSDTLAAGESIYLRGLGTFDVRTAKEKIGRNIGKGEAVTIPAHKRVKFIVSKKIKHALK